LFAHNVDINFVFIILSAAENSHPTVFQIEKRFDFCFCGISNREKMKTNEQVKPSASSLHPSRPITIVMCWPDVIRNSNHAYHDLENLARKAGVSIVVVDNTVLESMGVMMSKPAAQF
jgi:hypothetical protein